MALAVAGLWACHPARVESVAWVVERKDVLSGLFFLLGIGAYVEGRRGGLRHGMAPRGRGHKRRPDFPTRLGPPYPHHERLAGHGVILLVDTDFSMLADAGRGRFLVELIPWQIPALVRTSQTA